MTEQQYVEAMNKRMPQTFIGPATNPLPYRSGSEEYDDSYMLNKIANDPESPGNVRTRKQKEFAKNMGLALLSAIPFASWTRYYPLLRGLPEFASTMSRGARLYLVELEHYHKLVELYLNQHQQTGLLIVDYLLKKVVLI